MSVDFKSLRDSQPATLSGVADQWVRAKDKLGDAHVTATGVDSKMSRGAWFGAAADAAIDTTGKYVGQLSSGKSEAQAIKGIITDARDMFTESKDKLDKAVEEVEADDSLRVDDNGKVTVEPSDSIVEMKGQIKAEVIAAKETKADDLEKRIEEAVKQAQQDDKQTADALRTACDYDSGSSQFTSDEGKSGLGVWAEYKEQRFGEGTLAEGTGFAGYKDDHDFGRYGKAEWKAGGQLSAGGYVPDRMGDGEGGWVGAYGGADATYKTPTTDLGLDGVSANLDPSVQAGYSQGASVNDPRAYTVETNGSEVRIQSNYVSHSFESVPVTIGLNVDVTIDMDEYRDNFILDTFDKP